MFSFCSTFILITESEIMSMQGFINQHKNEPDTKRAQKHIDSFLSNLTENQMLEKLIEAGEFWAAVTIGFQPASRSDAAAERVGKQLQELEEQGKIYTTEDDNGNFLGIHITKKYLESKKSISYISFTQINLS